MLFFHQSLDVFHDHDGIVHKQPDRQHHGEHRHHVDSEPTGVQHAKGTEQHHRHRQGWNQGRTNVLQEQQHDQKHQDDCLEQGMHHRVDRGFHRRAGVVGVNDFYAGRQVRFKLVDSIFYAFDGLQHVRAGGQAQRNTGCRFTVVVDVVGVGFIAQHHFSQILQANLSTVRLHLDQNFLELISGFQPGFTDHRRAQLNTFTRRQSANSPGRDLDVLRRDSGGDIAGHQLVAIELGGIKPDPHRILEAKHEEVAHPLGTGQRILEARHDDVAQVTVAQLSILRINADQQHEVHLELHHTDPLPLHFRWQVRRRKLKLVLNLNLRDIRIDALVESHGDFNATVTVCCRTDVTQAIQAVQLLLDDLHHRILNGLRRGTWVGDGYLHGRRRDIGILIDRKAVDRQGSTEHDRERDHPSKNWPINEETRHCRPLSLPSKRCSRGRSMQAALRRPSPLGRTAAPR
ncbi:hypothetical protein D3C80_203210 [compost metagenome]